MPQFPTVTKRKHIPNVISPEDQERVLDAIPEAARGIYILAAEEVFRPGELRALNVADYNFQTRVVTVRHAMDGDTNQSMRKSTKEEDVRVRQVSGRATRWLERHIKPEDRLLGRPALVCELERTLCEQRPVQCPSPSSRLEARCRSCRAGPRAHVRGHEAFDTDRGPPAWLAARPTLEGSRPPRPQEH